MRRAVLPSGVILACFSGYSSADEKPDRLKEDWKKLEGTWVTPYRAKPGKFEIRSRLDLETSGDDRVVTRWEERKDEQGMVWRMRRHSAVLMVVTIEEKEHSTYLVVCPKMLPQRRRHKSSIQYEIGEGKLKLRGELGIIKVTDEWTRLEDKK
jgi:hypothetical protein